MYRNILVALENSRADETLVPHIQQLAALVKARLVLVHVADGWVARHYDRLKLAESEEMRQDRCYLESVAERLRSGGLEVSVCLALGDPPTEILKTAAAEQCDLIAMTTHGHRLLGDILHGSTIEQVRHRANIPLLVVRAKERQ